MQNTTTTKEIPNKLMENFFISGLPHEEILLHFKDTLGNDSYQNVFKRFDPSILFSMYSSPENYKKYVQFIFPKKIQLGGVQQPEPQFHTFSTTELDGNQSFFHCFTFYECMSKFQLVDDFDYNGIHRKKQQLVNELAKNQRISNDQKKQNKGKPTYVDKPMDPLQNLEDLYKTNQAEKRIKKHIAEDLERSRRSTNQVPRDMFTNKMSFAPGMYGQDNRQTTMNKTFEVGKFKKVGESMEKMRDHSIMCTKLNKKKLQEKLKFFNNIQDFRVTINDQIKEQIQKDTMIFDGDKDESRLQSLKMDPGYEDVDKYIDTSQYSDTRQTNPINIYHTTHPLATLKRTDKSNSNVTSSKNDNSDLQITQTDTACFGGPLKIDIKQQIDDASFDHLTNASFLSQMPANSSPNEMIGDTSSKIKSEEQKAAKSEKYYIPVALVIQSKTEFHDAFKIILTQIYESLRNPKSQSNVAKDGRKLKSDEDRSSLPDLDNLMAFAEMITHIAYLRTIPAPVFNSQITIKFMDCLINLRENKFNELPHKNNDAIQILIDCLDFQTILLCWKGLIFDKTLIVFSYETSLLFNIVEGLKQLMFPITVDFQQILPANDLYEDDIGETLRDFFDNINGFTPVIFAIETSSKVINPFDEFQQMEDCVVLDIDASLARPSKKMSSDLPDFPKEIEMLKFLNRIKNRRMNNYDEVYYTEQIPKGYDKQTYIVQQIRELFFSELQQFLKPAYLAIKLEEKNPQSMNDYFDYDEYIDYFADNTDVNFQMKYIKFAQELVKTRGFAHFMDGYLEPDIVNFDLVNSILCEQRQLLRRYKESNLTFQKYENPIKNNLHKIDKRSQIKLKQLQTELCGQWMDKPTSFEDESVIFNYKMPSYEQRMMLFEKIQFMVDKHYDKLDKQFVAKAMRKSSKMQQEIDEFKHSKFYYQQIVTLIRNTYSNVIKDEKNKDNNTSKVVLQPAEEQQSSSLLDPPVEENNEMIRGCQRELMDTITTSFSGGSFNVINPIPLAQPCTTQPLVDATTLSFGMRTDSSTSGDVQTPTLLSNKTVSINSGRMSTMLDIPLNSLINTQYVNKDLNEAIQNGTLNGNSITLQQQDGRVVLRYSINPFMPQDQYKRTQTQPLFEIAENVVGEAKQGHKSITESINQSQRTFLTGGDNTSCLTCPQNATKVIYGKKGLITFLERLFPLLNENDFQKLNFYFTIRNSLIEHFELNYTYNNELVQEMEENPQYTSGFDYTKYEDQTVEMFNQALGPREEMKLADESEEVTLKLQKANTQGEFKNKNKSSRKISYHSNTANSNQNGSPQKSQNTALDASQLTKSSMTKSRKPAMPVPTGNLVNNDRMKTIIIRDCQPNWSNQTNKQQQVPLQIVTNNVNFIKDINQTLLESRKPIKEQKQPEYSFTQSIHNQLNTANPSEQVLIAQENANKVQVNQFDKFDDETQWFWIEKKTKRESEGALDESYDSQDSQELKDHLYESIKYQEVLFFMKLVNTFEEEKDQTFMNLWLILNNPLIWSNVPNHLLNVDSDDHYTVDPFYKKCEVLLYLFPINKFILTLDNLTRQQVCDLYIRIVENEETQRYRLSPHSNENEINSKQSKVNEHYSISQLEKNFIFKFEGEYSRNQILDGKDQEQVRLPTFKDIIKLIITEQYEQVNGQFKREWEDQHKLYTASFNFPGQQSKLSVAVADKRDIKSNAYFLTIDERVFAQCSIEKLNIEKMNKQKLQLLENQKLPPRTEERKHESSDSIGNFSMLERDEKNLERRDTVVNKRPSVTMGDDKAAAMKSKEKKKLGFKQFMQKTFNGKSKSRINSPIREQDEDGDEDENNQVIKSNKETNIVDNHFSTEPVSPMTNLNETLDRMSITTDQSFGVPTEINRIGQTEKQIFNQSIHEPQKLTTKNIDTYCENKINSYMSSNLHWAKNLCQPQDCSYKAVGGKRIKRMSTPLAYSIKFLHQIIKFWCATKQKNLDMLNKDISTESDIFKEQRIETLQQYYVDYYTQFEDVELCFKTREDEVSNSSLGNQEYQELCKQCFFVNIYNGMTLFKLAEIGTIKGTKLFNFKNNQSWIALEQNSFIKINKQIYTAYQIKNEIVKNVNGKAQSPFVVDKLHLHPLIDFAFFQPHNDSLYLKDLCFYDINQLKHKFEICLYNPFVKQIKSHIQSKIKVRESFSLILMPACLKKYFPTSAEEDEMDSKLKRECSLDRKSKKCKLSQNSYQKRVHDFLVFVRNNILDYAEYQNSNKVHAIELKDQSFKNPKFCDSSQQATIDDPSYHINLIIKRIQARLLDNSIVDQEYIVEFKTRKNYRLKAEKLKKGLQQFCKYTLSPKSKKMMTAMIDIQNPQD